jgi:hypothetical protein
MASIGTQSIGKLQIYLKQGNTQTIALKFSNKLPDGTLEPIDLTSYTFIKMYVKKQIDINTAPFILWDLDSGLNIIGDNNDVLEFTFNQEFSNITHPKWYYDILFIDEQERNTLIGGEILIRQVVTT